MKLTLIVLIALTFFFNGCAQKEPQTIFIDAPLYNFQKISLNGIYVDAKTKEIQRICTPVVLEASKIYKHIINDFYEYQIDEYNKQNKENKNETDTQK